MRICGWCGWSVYVGEGDRLRKENMCGTVIGGSKWGQLNEKRLVKRCECVSRLWLMRSRERTILVRCVVCWEHSHGRGELLSWASLLLAGNVAKKVGVWRGLCPPLEGVLEGGCEVVLWLILRQCRP